METQQRTQRDAWLATGVGSAAGPLPDDVATAGFKDSLRRDSEPSTANGFPTSVIVLLAFALLMAVAIRSYPMDQLRSSLVFNFLLALVCLQSFIVMDPEAEAALAQQMQQWASLRVPMACGTLALLSVWYAGVTCNRVWRATDSKSRALGSTVAVSWGLVINCPELDKAYLRHVRQCDHTAHWLRDYGYPLMNFLYNIKLAVMGLDDSCRPLLYIERALFVFLLLGSVIVKLQGSDILLAWRVACWRVSAVVFVTCINVLETGRCNTPLWSNNPSASEVAMKSAAHPLMLLLLGPVGVRYLWIQIPPAAVAGAVKFWIVTSSMALQGEESWEVIGLTSGSGLLGCCLCPCVVVVSLWLAVQYQLAGSNLQRFITIRAVHTMPLAHAHDANTANDSGQ